LLLCGARVLELLCQLGIFLLGRFAATGFGRRGAGANSRSRARRRCRAITALSARPLPQRKRRLVACCLLLSQKFGSGRIARTYDGAQCTRNTCAALAGLPWAI